MRHRLLGQHTGLRVSELVLGTGAFGTGWGHGVAIDTVGQVLDTYADAGGNFIDTADTYQAGESERQLGSLLEGRRDAFVLASKYSFGIAPKGLLANGNSRRSMVTAVEVSLKRLRTDRLDLYWGHFSDGFTPMEEILRGLDDLSKAGKILYAGLSDFPAWRVARAATPAELRRLLPIAAVQFEQSLVARSCEHELMPMVQALGLSGVARSPLGGGLLTGKYRRGEQGHAQGFGRRVFQPESSVERRRILDELIAMADELGASPGQLAIAWVLDHGSLTLIGPGTVEQVIDNLVASELRLTAERRQRFDAVSAIAPIFPHTMLDSAEHREGLAAGQLTQIQ